MIGKEPNRKWIELALLAAACLLSAGLAARLVFPGPAPALAAPNPQIPIYTPTALPDGRIIYKVKANDTLLSISLLTGVPVEKLKALNNLSGDTIYEGQDLLLGLAGPPEVTNTPGPSPTPTEFVPTATPLPGSGNLCILLFDDLNGDSIRQENEPTIPDGAISVIGRSGGVSLSATTKPGTDPYCFEKVPEGDYNISVAIPAGYNPTTVTNYALALKAGDETYLDFGAQADSETLSQAPVPTGSGKSPLLGVIGGLFVAAGLVLALFAGRLLKSR